MASPGGTVVKCQSCGKQLRVRAELMGKKVKCPGCGGVIDTAGAVQARAGQMRAAQLGQKSKKAEKSKTGFMAGAPDTVRALVLGVIMGASWGIGLGIVGAILLTVASAFLGDSARQLEQFSGGSVILAAVILIVFYAVYYAIFGGLVGTVLGATHNVWAGVATAAIFVALGYFAGGLCGIVMAIIFTASLIGALNKNMN